MVSRMSALPATALVGETVTELGDEGGISGRRLGEPHPQKANNRTENPRFVRFFMASSFAWLSESDKVKSAQSAVRQFPGCAHCFYSLMRERSSKTAIRVSGCRGSLFAACANLRAPDRETVMGSLDEAAPVSTHEITRLL